MYSGIPIFQTLDFSNLPIFRTMARSTGFAIVKHYNFPSDLSNPRFFEPTPDISNQILRPMEEIYLRFLEPAGKYYSVAFI